VFYFREMAEMMGRDEITDTSLFKLFPKAVRPDSFLGFYMGYAEGTGSFTTAEAMIRGLNPYQAYLGAEGQIIVQFMNDRGAWGEPMDVNLADVGAYWMEKHPLHRNDHRGDPIPDPRFAGEPGTVFGLEPGDSP
jgi:hypothetical protein